MAEESRKEIQKATPARALSPFEEMDRMFDRFFGRAGCARGASGGRAFRRSRWWK